jgi:hypothetical protein
LTKIDTQTFFENKIILGNIDLGEEWPKIDVKPPWLGLGPLRCAHPLAKLVHHVKEALGEITAGKEFF